MEQLHVDRHDAGRNGGSSDATQSLAFPSASNAAVPSTFNGNPALQEYWARRDRQQMARDIYVMLYMFGGGQDTP